MNIRIESQPALLGLDIKEPHSHFHEKASQVTRRAGNAEVKVDITTGKVIVNNKPPREAIHIYDYHTLARHYAKEGHKKALEGIKRRVQEGFQMSDVHKNGFVLHKICAQTAWPNPKQVEVKPKPPADIKYQEGRIDIKAKIIPDQYDISFYNFDISLDWGRVEAYLLQRDYIDVIWTGNILDLVK